MLHEITDPEEDFFDFERFNSQNGRDENDLIQPNQRLEVVKITRCKMRAKDVLEIEIGLKNLILRKKQFEERTFILRFLNK